MQIHLVNAYLTSRWKMMDGYDVQYKVNDDFLRNINETFQMDLLKI